MNESKISVRYARALFELAKEEKLNDQVKSNMLYLLGIIDEVPEFRLLIDDPLIKINQKKEIVRALFKNQLEDLTLQFLYMIIRSKRESYLPSITRTYMKFYKKDKGIKSAVFTTPQPVSDTLRNTIIKLVSKKLNIRVELEEKTDEKLIGGFILRIEDQQIDASVASHLNNIRKELLNS